MKKPKRIVIVGAGGIGGWLIPSLCQFLHFCNKSQEKIEVIIFDGDIVEERNFERQNFQELGAKAGLMKRKMSWFDSLRITAFTEYITNDNVRKHIRDDDWVMLAVDNHATRKLLSERFEELSDGVLISGGNEYVDGCVNVYIREGGEDVTEPLTQSHPEIANPNDKNPGEASCEELAQTSAPQLIFANQRAATIMNEVFYNLFIGHNLKVDRIYFNIQYLAQRAEQTKIK